MEFREFEYVITVAECRSFTKASEKLYVSQPTISQTITNVEERLGVKLFDRSTFPITVTYPGQRYIKVAKEILGLRDNLIKELEDISHKEMGTIRMGMPTERAAHVIPLILGEFKTKYPKYDVNVIENSSKNLRKMILDKEVDILLLPENEKSTEYYLERQFIYNEKLLIAAKKGVIKEEDLVGKSKRNFLIDNIVKYPIIMLRKGHAMRFTLDLILREFGNQNIYMETDSHIYSALLASKGFGITIVPTRTREVLKYRNELEYFYIKTNKGKLLKREIYAYCRKEYYMSNAEREMLKIMIEKLKN
ncbi:LysR family transcriptional regulator [Anaerosphaera multitolerans]|uniref:LysR family transcriptional regulator n=1 Tax=Anaerosphaera multitolerans TaxID=2487351 RepID=A0A437S9Z0_9FIRM|nr:LysR family transcriptional regulator [Anaerosphaera multitolerans]RVU55664.1 LysR family transcriptional regulator [Anaerosphaera multitolerans]